jgi:hypothetical protein
MSKAKFQNLEKAFWYIRENPLKYLPEKSLSLFNAFWIGYEWRYEFENREFKGFALLDGFHEFMGKKFRVPSNRNSLGIAEFYSQNEAEAFDLWFESLEEFLSKKDGMSEIEMYYFDRRNQDLFRERREIDLFGIMKMMFKRIAMYVGSNFFTLLTFVLFGWLRARQDFNFEESAQEKIFRDFQKYIEDRPFWLRAEQTGFDLPPMPSWNKILWFRTAHIQKEEKALEMFAEYFDEFAFQGKGCIEYVEFHWKVHHETLEKFDHFVEGKFLVGK